MKLTTIPSLTSRRQNRSRNSLLSENDTVGSMNSCTCVHVAVNCIVTTTFTCITVKLHVHVVFFTSVKKDDRVYHSSVIFRCTYNDRQWEIFNCSF